MSKKSSAKTPLSVPSIRGQTVDSLFQFLPQDFSFLLRCFAWHEQGLTKSHNDRTERKGHLKTIPALQTDFPSQMLRCGNNGPAGQLGQGDDAILQHVARTARAIRGNGQIVALLSPGRQFQQGLWPTPARRATHRLHTEMFEDASHDATIFAGADDGRKATRLLSPLDVIVI